jgi:hypothetical protein
MSGYFAARPSPSPNQRNQQEFGAHKSLDQSEQPGRETYPLSAQDGGLESGERAEANK